MTPAARSPWPPRLLLASTVALVLCFVASGPLRSVLALVWVLLAIGAVVIERRARRRAAAAAAAAPAVSPRSRQRRRRAGPTPR